MKTTIIMSAFILCTSLLAAQTTNKPATVRIKKIENINGVEKITDTTFTTNDPNSIMVEDGTINIIGDDKDGNMTKTIIIKDAKGEDVTVNVEGLSDEINTEVSKALKEAGVDENAKGTKKIIIINDENDKHPGDKKDKHETKVVVVKRIDIKSVDESEMKRINKSAGETDGKLNVEKMNFYPNPSTGKFNLSFSLADKGDAEITILNIDGKVVYKEKFANTAGNYDKEIDISKNAKGVYFVKVEQGKHAQVKKIVLE